MPIEITQYPTKPALAYNRVHVCELRIIIAETQEAPAAVRIVYKLYGVDEEGVKHYAKEQDVLTIADAFVAALTNPALAQALLGVEAGVAALLTESGKLGEAAVV